MSEDIIERLNAQIKEIRAAWAFETTALREENARLAALSAKASLEASQLREALEPFADELKEQQVEVPHVTEDERIIHSYTLRLKHLRAAAAAIREGENNG